MRKGGGEHGDGHNEVDSENIEFYLHELELQSLTFLFHHAVKVFSYRAAILVEIPRIILRLLMDFPDPNSRYDDWRMTMPTEP